MMSKFPVNAMNQQSYIEVFLSALQKTCFFFPPANLVKTRCFSELLLVCTSEGPQYLNSCVYQQSHIVDSWGIFSYYGYEQ